MVTGDGDPLQPIRHLYPFASHFLDLDGHRMHFVDEGSGPAVLMLHGNPTWSFYYRNLIEGLRGSHRVIVPDHVGCGLSDKPQQYSYRLATHVENVRRLVVRLGLDSFDLVVHDWGGAIGFGMARLMMERIRRIVVLNTAAFSGSVPWRIAVCRWPVVGGLGVRGLNLFAGAATVMAVRKRMRPDVRGGYLFPYGSWADRIAIQRFVEDIPTRRDHPTYDLIETIDRDLALFRDRKMLICWGMRDFCFDEAYLNGWVKRFPDAEVHRFADAGHYVLEDVGGEVFGLVARFLERGEE